MKRTRRCVVILNYCLDVYVCAGADFIETVVKSHIKGIDVFVLHFGTLSMVGVVVAGVDQNIPARVVVSVRGEVGDIAVKLNSLARILGHKPARVHVAGGEQCRKIGAIGRCQYGILFGSGLCGLGILLGRVSILRFCFFCLLLLGRLAVRFLFLFLLFICL